MKTCLKFAALSILLTLPLYVAGQEQQQESPRIRFSASAGMDWYNSFSQKKNDMPMKMGYPVFDATPLRLGAGVSIKGGKCTHRFILNVFHANTIEANDGLENNYILDAQLSSFTGASLEHHMKGTLLQYQPFALHVAPVAGLDFQRRNMNYKSGVRERTTDINFFLGFCPVAALQLGTKWKVQGGFDAFAYLPYLNTGTLTRWDASDRQIEQAQYRAFYYRTRLHHSLRYALDENHALRIGYRLNKTVGFANRKPRFYIKELIHHRMERSHSVYMQYNF